MLRPKHNEMGGIARLKYEKRIWAYLGPRLKNPWIAADTKMSPDPTMVVIPKHKAMAGIESLQNIKEKENDKTK